MLASGLKLKSNNQLLEEQGNIDEMKKKSMKRRKASKLFREILFNGMFLWILFVVSYSNKDVNSYNYKNSLSNLLLDGFEEVTHSDTLYHFFNFKNFLKKKVKTTSDIWVWLKESLLPNIVDANSYYNELKDERLNSFAKDHSSFLFTYPILRQKRVKNSKFFFYFATNTHF